MSQSNPGQLTNEQLALLDTLMYLDGDSEHPGISSKNNEKHTLGKYLDNIDINSIPTATKDENGNIKDGITNLTRDDWQQIIDSAKNDKQLSNLTIESVLPDPNNKKASGACFVDDAGNATVAFRGTGTYEWLDNAKTGYSSDTEQQLLAKEWVDSLGYDDMTVIGHSKGGNKAEYVTIATDKIARCVAFDAPGFCEEFCNKYKDEIAEKKDRISLVTPQDAYVSNLFFNIAGNTTYYETSGTTVDKLSKVKIDLATLIKSVQNKEVPEDLMNAGILMGRAHMPNSFYTIKDGKVQFNAVTTQDSSMKLLHECIEFIDKNASKEDKEYFFGYIMNKLQGEEQRIALGDPPDGFSGRMVNLLKEWIGTLNITKKQKDKLELLILKSIMGKGDASEVSALLAQLASQASETTLHSLQNTIRDFSTQVKQNLISSIKDVEGVNPLDFKGWAQWDELDSSIKSKLEFRGINRYCSYIRAYYLELIEKNNSSIDKINNIFEKVYQIDNDYSSKLKEQCEKLKDIEVNIKKLTERFDTSSIDVDLTALKAK